MRRVWLVVLLAVGLLSGDAEAQSCNGCGIGYIAPGGPSGLSSSGTALTSTVPLLLPNGTAGAPSLSWSADPDTGFYKAGLDFIDVSMAGTVRYRITGTSFSGLSNQLLGAATAQWYEAFVSLSSQGSRPKTLTEASATNFVTVAVPQTAGSNYAAGEVHYTVYASDGTDTQVLNGSAFFSAVNKAGTETCTLTDDQIGAEAASAGTLVCTPTCVVGLTDVVALAMNCTSSLTQTTLKVDYHLEMQKTNTATEQ